jgi:hypothetical protein
MNSNYEHSRESAELYGFNFGAAAVNRACSRDGWVILTVDTPRETLEVYVTKTGKIRVFKPGKELT